jgi:spore germination cell wall hydrolase CwlJ-like protein
MTTTMSLSHASYKAVINSIQLLIFGLGLCLTIFAVYGITDTKLRNLKIEETAQLERLHNAMLTDKLKQAEAIKAQQLHAEKLKQLECLARNVYWEAAAEPFEGKVAVAQVTINRLESGRYGNTICQVVFQRTKVYETVICQFSWTCTGKSRVPPKNLRLFKESEDIARKVYFENYRLPNMTKAMYFHNTTVRPGWNKVKIAQIGQHVFYRD